MLDRQRPQSDPLLTFVDLDVAELVKATIAATAPLATASGLTLEGAYGTRLPHVIADARCVRQILLNLIGNALKFTPRGGSVGITVTHADDGLLRVTVQDTGPGMPEDAIARAVAAGASAAEQLRNPDPIAHRRGGGLGLGLPICHALAAANGARLEISSAGGAGTRADLVFPADRVVPI